MKVEKQIILKRFKSVRELYFIFVHSQDNAFINTSKSNIRRIY